MADFKVVLPADMKVAARINKTQQREQERKKVIFNPKSRMIGIDVSGLEMQVQEKRNSKLKNKSYDDYYSRLQRQDEAHFKEMEDNLAQEKRKMHLELDYFRRNCQNKNTKSFSNLNGNAFKVGSRYIPEVDQRNTLTSSQRFECEDDVPEERRNEQKKQQKTWLEQQILEKKRSKEERKKYNEVLTVSNESMDRRILELDNMGKQCRRDLAKSMEQYNKIIALEKANQIKTERKEEQNDKLMEIKNNLTSDFMTEQLLSVPSNLGLNKIVSTSYKGMTGDQYKAIKEFQINQIEENKERTRLQQLEEKKWVALNMETINQQEKLDTAVRMEKRNLKKELQWENEQLAHQQEENRRFMNKYVHKVVPATDEFYNKFNTLTR